MNKYKAIVTDIDGTLVTGSGIITEKTLSSLRRFMASGGKYAIISGRGANGIYPLLERYELHCPAIAYSGGLILDEHRKVLYNKTMSWSRAKRVRTFLKEKGYNITVCAYFLEYWWVEDMADPRVVRESEYVHALPEQVDFDRISDDQQINKLLCILEEPDMPVILPALKKAFPDMEVVASAPILIEIMEKGVSKADGIAQLCSHWEIDPSEVIAFGDSYNDLSMLRFVGCPVVMGNAPEEIRKEIGRVTRSNEEDGIAWALEKAGICT